MSEHTIEELKAIAKEYDDAPDDAEWNPSHPIFMLAQENDNYKEVIREMQAQLDACRKEIDLCYKMNCGRDYMHLPLADAVAEVLKEHRELNKELVEALKELEAEYERLGWGFNAEMRSKHKALIEKAEAVE